MRRPTPRRARLRPYSRLPRRGRARSHDGRSSWLQRGECLLRAHYLRRAGRGLCRGGAGARRFRRAVVVTDADPPAAPCGACRQVLAEFGRDLDVDLWDRREYAGASPTCCPPRSARNSSDERRRGGSGWRRSRRWHRGVPGAAHRARRLSRALPGREAEVFDTVLTPRAGGQQLSRLRRARSGRRRCWSRTDLPASEDRAVYRFAPRTDSIAVRDSLRATRWIRRDLAQPGGARHPGGRAEGRAVPDSARRRQQHHLRGASTPQLIDAESDRHDRGPRFVERRTAPAEAPRCRRRPARPGAGATARSPSACASAPTQPTGVRLGSLAGGTAPSSPAS